MPDVPLPANGSTAWYNWATQVHERTTTPQAPASHTHGVTDLTATGTRSSSTYLRGDNTWATPAGGGGGGGTPGTGRNALTGMFHADGYGVVVDITSGDTTGRTANTTALAACVADANSVGGTIKLPPGIIRYNAGALALDNAHLLGEPGGTNFARTNVNAYLGTTLMPYSTTADQAAITLTRDHRGCVLRGFSLDLRNMANGSTNDPFTRSQTKGVFVDASWNYGIENVHIRGVPSNAAAVYVNDGSPSLGAFWGRLINVFVDEWTKVSIANGHTSQAYGVKTEAQKDPTARGMVFHASDPSMVTGISMVDTTTYRGLYFKNVDTVSAVNLFVEDAPEHGVYIDAGQRIVFNGGLWERPGTDTIGQTAPGGHRVLKGANLPAQVFLRGVTLAGVGVDFAEWGGGFTLEDDDLGLVSQARSRRWGDLVINGAGSGTITGNADFRILGPYSTTAIASDGSDTALIGVYNSSNVATWDPLGLYNNTSGNISLPMDAITGATGKFTVTYGIQLRLSTGTFAYYDFVDLKLAPTGTVLYPGGAGGPIQNRHQFMTGGTTQYLTGTFEVTVHNSTGHFNLKISGYTANLYLGLDATDIGRGFIAMRQVT